MGFDAEEFSPRHAEPLISDRQQGSVRVGDSHFREPEARPSSGGSGAGSSIGTKWVPSQRCIVRWRGGPDTSATVQKVSPNLMHAAVLMVTL